MFALYLAEEKIGPEVVEKGLVLERGPGDAAEGDGGGSREQAGVASSSEPPESPAPSRCSQTWVMLIKRVYEIDPTQRRKEKKEEKTNHAFSGVKYGCLSCRSVRRRGAPQHAVLPPSKITQ